MLFIKYCSLVSIYINRSLKQSPDDIAGKYESHFDGNICRCTGYRPIMDAMQHCTDIEVISVTQLK